MRRMIGWFGLTLCWSVGAAEPEAPTGEALTGPRLVHWTEIKIKNHVVPKYPRKARNQDLEGDCKVRLIIDERGKTTSVEIITCPPEFAEVSTQAAMDTDFFPMKVEGVPVKAAFVLTYKFRLGDAPSPAPSQPLAPPPPDGLFVEQTFPELSCSQLAQVPYPEQARAAGVESACRVMLYLNAQGEVIFTEALDCGEPFLSAVRAPTQPFICAPVVQDGEAIPVIAEYTFNFRLQ